MGIVTDMTDRQTKGLTAACKKKLVVIVNAMLNILFSSN